MMVEESKVNWVQEQVRLGAYRWLHQLDLNSSSLTQGVADREYWSWKTKDFSNGTWQGGLAGVLDAHPLLELTHDQLCHLVLATLRGTHFIQRGNGSFEEAYPYESSYAVTSLVLFNLLYSFFAYPEYFGKEALVLLDKIVTRASAFLEKTPETHGIISNHRATADLALLLSRKFLSQPPVECAFLMLQEEEGWFPEYSGCDPGYQTLLNHYIVACFQVTALPRKFESALSRSNQFLTRFCFPDGSFSGEIGSRGTSIVYPSGLWNSVSEGGTRTTATPLTTWFFNRHAEFPGAVWPTSTDPGNFVPIFNSWALVARLAQAHSLWPEEPAFFPTNQKIWTVTKADLIGVSTPQTHLVLSLKNGAIRKCVKDGEKIQDTSVVAYTHGEMAYTPIESEVTDRWIKITLRASHPSRMLNNAWRASLLRGIGLFVYLFPWAQRLLKRVLSYIVMNRKGARGKGRLEISIDLTSVDLPIRIETISGEKPSLLNYGFNQHMASANAFDPRAL